MKKIFCVLLVVIMLVLSGCTDKNDAEPVLLNDYLEKIKNFESVVHEYGEEQSRVLFGEKLVATVLYPETDIDNLDSEIRQWINNILSEYQIEASEEELKEIISKEMYKCYGDIDVKEIKFVVGTAFCDDVPKVSCEVKVEIPVLTLPL